MIIEQCVTKDGEVIVAWIRVDQEQARFIDVSTTSLEAEGCDVETRFRR